MTTTKTPAAIRQHLSRQHTNVVMSDAQIVEWFSPSKGWTCVGYHGMRPTVQSVQSLSTTKGATMFAVEYTLRGAKRRADFSVREVLS